MKNALIQYLNSRKVTIPEFIEFMASDHKIKKYKLFTVNGQDYTVSCFFDSSDTIGYDLIKTNEILKTKETPFVAFAAVEGDDVICLNVNDNSIWLWCLESDDGNFLKIADSFDDFIKMLL